MLVEVWSDTVCPWCYVGVRRLQRALEERPAPATPVELRFLPFQLNPDLPESGEDRRAWLTRRFGDPDRFAPMLPRLQEIGATLGIEFRFDLMTRMPNTLRSHRVIAAAGGASQLAVKEKILEGYFSRGLDIGDPEVLVALAGEAGMPEDLARQALGDEAFGARVQGLCREGVDIGVSGVPTFVFGRKVAFSGAQEVEMFHRAFEAAAA